MKKFLLALCALALCLGSCSEDFDVAAPYRQITVIYGILDVRNPAQYIRVQKAFMDENGSAVDMSQQPDSSLYPEGSLRVQIRELDSTGINVTTTFPDLPRVDLNLEAEEFRKAAGDFFGAPSYAYKFTGTLNPARRYRLVVTNTSTGRVDSAETEVINPDRSAFELLQIDLVSDYKINFSITDATTQLRFNRLPATAKILEAVMRFHVINRNTTSGVETRDSFDFTFARADTTQGIFPPRLEASNLSFYSFLAGALGDAPANVERYLDSPDVLVYAGTRDLLNYSLFTNATGGLTGDQVRPTYTNIRSNSGGGDALGLFAGRTVRIALEVPIAAIVFDSLARNSQTDGLNIKGIYNR